MNKLDLIEQALQNLQQQINILQTRVDTNNEFQTDFSGKLIINKEVQFKQKVYDKSGGLVSEINT